MPLRTRIATPSPIMTAPGGHGPEPADDRGSPTGEPGALYETARLLRTPSPTALNDDLPTMREDRP